MISYDEDTTRLYCLTTPPPRVMIESLDHSQRWWIYHSVQHLLSRLCMKRLYGRCVTNWRRNSVYQIAATNTANAHQFMALNEAHVIHQGSGALPANY